MKKNRRPKNDPFKKSLKNFMKDESGNMTKENILKMGVGTMAALGMLGGLGNIQHASAEVPFCDNMVTHLSDNTLNWEGPDGGAKVIAPSHTHHYAHCSY